MPQLAPPGEQRVPQTATYQGAPAQGPGFNQASALSQALQGYVTGPGQEALAGQTGLLTGPGGSLDLSTQSLDLQKALTGQEAGFSLGQLGIQGSNLALQQALLGQEAGPGGFQSQQLKLTGQEEAQQLGQSQRGLRSSATASGAINTAGTQQNWSDLLKNYGLQQQQLKLTGKEEQAQYAASKGQLDNAAKSLGISTQEVIARLNNALAQYGLQGKVDANSIAQQVAALQQGYISSTQASALQTLLASAGIPLQSLLGGTGG